MGENQHGGLGVRREFFYSTIARRAVEMKEMARGVKPWFIWMLCANFYLYAFFQRVAPSVMITELMRDFGVTAVLLGNLSAFYYYAYAAIQLPVGVLLDRFGPRRVLSAALLLSGLGSLLFATAGALPQAYFGRLLIGAGVGFALVGTLKVAAVWFPPKRFALVTGFTFMLGMLGAVGGQAPLALVDDAVGWRGTLMGAAAVALLGAPLIWLAVREGPEPEARMTPVRDIGLLRSLRLIATTPQTWVCSIYSTTNFATMLAFVGLWGVPYMMEAHGLSRPAAALSTSLVLIGFGIGGPLFGWFSDYVGRRRIPMRASSVGVLITFSLIIYGPGLPLSAIDVLLFTCGVSQGGAVLGFVTAREHNLPGADGATLGFINTISVSSGAILQPFIGWLLDLNWDGRMEGGAQVFSVEAYRTAFLSLLVACGIAVMTAFLVRETFCQRVRGET